MPELLLELFSEEIPARMQAAAARELSRLMIEALDEAGLAHGEPKAFATPRRLAFTVDGMPTATADVREEKKGPRVGAPDAAMQGFLRATGLMLADLQKRDDAKGAFYVALIEKKGRAAVEVISDIVPTIVRSFYWPKSMRWGAGTLRWVRPLHSVIAVFDGKPVPFEIDTGAEEIIAGDATRGHRFLSEGAIHVRAFADYQEKLRFAHVILDGEERKAIIARELKRLAAAEGLEPIEDVGLLEEVAGLVEDPVVLLGSIDKEFLDVPHEVLSTAMRAHQKYFSLKDAKSGKFAARFGVVSNLRAADGGKAIVAGNERVLRARLSDARFFWDQDLRTRLSDRVSALNSITFHARCGSVGDKVVRIVKHAGEIGLKVFGRDVADRAVVAARLCKADLTSGMVGEFPELQGVMGRYYALRDSDPAIRDPRVADAIRDHYKPIGVNDTVAKAPESVVVALADKLDSLVELWYAGERPTGSKDPLALRRLAIGIIKTIIENALSLRLLDVFSTVDFAFMEEPAGVVGEEPDRTLLSFIADRLKVYLRDRGARHDLVDAVFSLPGQDDLVLIVKRVEALSKFLETEEGRSLRVAHDRAANILRIEEKKDGKSYAEEPDAKLFQQNEERELAAAIAKMQKSAGEAVAKADFEAAMKALAQLRTPVDRFFDEVTVNAPEKELRANRLKLLALIRRAMTEVADFSKLEGAS